jgi:hypothetical protein
MPVFIRPARVAVDEGGSGVAAIAAVVAVAVIITAAAAVIADIITALAIAAVAAVLGSAGALVIVLRRNGVALVQRPPAPARAPVLGPAAATAQTLSAPRPLAIGPPRTVHGTTGQPHITEERT